MDETMTLYFIQHSCYLVEGSNAFYLFDYFGEGDPHTILSKAPEKPLYILTTHSHHDHYSPAIFKEFGGRDLHYIFHSELRDKVPSDQLCKVHFLETGESYKDNHLWVKAFGSTDVGGSFYCKVEGLSLFHAGDLNNWHWNEEADDRYIRQYEAAWQAELTRLTAEVTQLDLLMFPTDLRLGKDYLKGLRELLDLISIRHLAPMHLNGQLNPSELEALARQHHFNLLLPQPLTARQLL